MPEQINGRHSAADFLVLVSTDGSEASIHSIERAHALMPAAATWEIVTVAPEPVDPNEGTGGFGGPLFNDDEARQIDRAQLVEADGALAQTARAMGAVPVRQTVLRGEPASELCRYAELVAADVLVVASHQHSKLGAALLRSVIADVIKHAPCPVLVVPGD